MTSDSTAEAFQSDRTAEAFHEGEQAVQARAGMRERLQQIGPLVIRDHMPAQHRQFFGQLPFVLVGSLDAQGQPRASLLPGRPGFISSPTARRLRIEAAPLPGDPLTAPRDAEGAAGIVAGMPLGFLGIEQHTRRRNRMNGHVDKVDDRGFEVAVDQSFGNCPKYIQARRAEYVGPGDGPGPRGGVTALDVEVHDATALDAEARAVIARADTFFIASAHRLQGVDVSHRGGPPGFVRVTEDGALLAPDYAGNNFFNTLGNLSLDPRAGLLFLDFDSGTRLHVAVKARTLWEPRRLAGHEGALRLLQFEVLQVRRIEGGLPLRWGPAEMSPYLPWRGAGAAGPDRR